MMNSVIRAFGAGVDTFGTSAKGRIITEALVRQDLAEETLHEAYLHNKEYVDEWASHIRFSAIASAVSGGSGSSNSNWQLAIGTLLIGTALGYMAATHMKY
ncbi:MAG: hypothetical protein LAT67_05090 [Balneolales bacterium]|nr:hypothetical protein [Balneolales bacterium]